MKARLHIAYKDSTIIDVPENIFEDENAYEAFEDKMVAEYGEDFDFVEPFRETSVEKLTRVCNFSRNGAMAQCFALQAIETFADAVIKAGIPEKDPDDKSVSFVSPELWLACAEEWKEELK